MLLLTRSTQLVERFNLSSRSVGDEPMRRLRILPPASSQNQKIGYIYSQLTSEVHIDRMLSIYKCADATFFLFFGNHMQGQRGLS